VGNRASHLRSCGGKFPAGRGWLLTNQRLEPSPPRHQIQTHGTMYHIASPGVSWTIYCEKAVDGNLRLSRNGHPRASREKRKGRSPWQVRFRQCLRGLEQPRTPTISHVLWRGRDQVKGLTSNVVDTLAAVRGNDRSACSQAETSPSPRGQGLDSRWVVVRR